jgi:hypothetical protein
MNLWFDVFIPWAEWYHFNRHLPLMEAKQQYLQEKAAYETTIIELAQKYTEADANPAPNMGQYGAAGGSGASSGGGSIQSGLQEDPDGFYLLDEEGDVLEED